MYTVHTLVINICAIQCIYTVYIVHCKVHIVSIIKLVIDFRMNFVKSLPNQGMANRNAKIH